MSDEKPTTTIRVEFDEPSSFAASPESATAPGRSILTTADENSPSLTEINLSPSTPPAASPFLDSLLPPSCSEVFPNEQSAEAAPMEEITEEAAAVAAAAASAAAVVDEKHGASSVASPPTVSTEDLFPAEVEDKPKPVDPPAPKESRPSVAPPRRYSELFNGNPPRVSEVFSNEQINAYLEEITEEAAGSATSGSFSDGGFEVVLPFVDEEVEDAPSVEEPVTSPKDVEDAPSVEEPVTSPEAAEDTPSVEEPVTSAKDAEDAPSDEETVETSPEAAVVLRSESDGAPEKDTDVADQPLVKAPPALADAAPVKPVDTPSNANGWVHWFVTNLLPKFAAYLLVHGIKLVCRAVVLCFWFFYAFGRHVYLEATTRNDGGGDGAPHDDDKNNVDAATAAENIVANIFDFGRHLLLQAARGDGDGGGDGAHYDNNATDNDDDSTTASDNDMGHASNGGDKFLDANLSREFLDTINNNDNHQTILKELREQAALVFGEENAQDEVEEEEGN